MQNWKSHLINIALLLIVGYHSISQSLPQISNKGIQVITHYLELKTNKRIVPGIVAVVANKKEIIYQRASGINSMVNKDSLRIDHLFTIASMTKAITAVAVMQLYEKGNIRIDDPIAEYLPELDSIGVIDQFNKQDTTFSIKHPSQPITIRHLLTHTSGIGYEWDNRVLNMINQKKYAGKLWQPYTDYPLLNEPGAKWNYGMSYDVLGKMIEKVSGISLDKYFYQNIFKPLGMENTFYTVPENKSSRLTNWYARNNGVLTEQQSLGKQKPNINGGGGLYATAEDYTRFLQMLLNKGTFKGIKILRKESVQEMTKNQIGDLFIETQVGAMANISNDFPSGAGKDKFGYGFVITTNLDNDGTKRKPGSYNWAGAFNTYYWVDPKSGIIAIILMQILPFYDKDCIEILDGFERLVYKYLNTNNARLPTGYRKGKR